MCHVLLAPHTSARLWSFCWATFTPQEQPNRWLKGEPKSVDRHATAWSDMWSLNWSHHTNNFPTKASTRLGGRLFHKGNYGFRGERDKLLKIYLWLLPFWGWLCPSSHLEGNGLCRQHNCSLFTTQHYISALTRQPLSYTPKNCWQSTERAPLRLKTSVIFPVWM